MYKDTGQELSPGAGFGGRGEHFTAVDVRLGDCIAGGAVHHTT